MKRWALVLFIFSSFQNPIFGEPAQHTPGQGGTDAAGRTTAVNNFKVDAKGELDEAKTLADIFSTSKEFIIRRYGKSGPEGLEKIKSTDFKQRDEAGFSKVLAELFGTKDNDQVAQMIPKIEELKTAATAKVKESGGDRYLEETKRMFWAAKYINGEPIKSEEAEAFYKFFRKDLADQLVANAEFKKKIEDNIAAGGNKDAVKDAVRKEVNHESLKAFLDSMASSKDPKSKKFGVDLADTVSFKDANGNKFLDFVGPSGEKQRFHLGKNSADIEKALSGASGKLVASTFAPAFHNTPDAGNEWYVKDGKFEKGSPNGFVPPAAPNQQAAAAGNAGSTGAQGASGPSGQGGAVGPQPQGQGGQGRPQQGQQGQPGQAQKQLASTSGRPSEADVKTFFDNKCAKCHSSADKAFTPTATGFKNAAGKVFGFAESAGRVTATPMMSGAVGDDGIAQLNAWANAK